MDDLTPMLSPKVARILKLSQEYDTIEAFLLAHPEITALDVLQVSTELMNAMGPAAEAFAGLAGRKPKANRRKRSAGGEAWQLKITLRGSKPPIWRRVVVPAEITLDVLHQVIQTAMGWYDCHLHLFDIDGKIFEAGRFPDGQVNDDREGLDESAHRLCDVVEGVKSKIRYVYDFGDDWEHTVLVEKIIPASEKPRTMVCLKGNGRCPMEDSGGVWGYYDKLAILGDLDHPEHEEIKEWMGDFDPAEEFDAAAVTKALSKIKT